METKKRTAQTQLLNKILQTGDFSVITQNNLSEQYFYENKAEFNFIKNHLNKYGNVPDRLTFADTFEDFDIIDVNESDAYLIEALARDYQTTQLAEAFNTVKGLVESGKDAEAMTYFQKMSEKIKPMTTMKCVDLMTDTSRYDRYVERASNFGKYYISTGFAELDQIIGGIDTENENFVIAARTGIGKSWTLIAMAAAASREGKRVGIYSGEMAVDKVGYRLDTLIGHVKNSCITRGDLYVQKEYKNYIDNLKYSDNGPVFVITPSDINGPATVDALRSFIESQNLDILFVDQYSLLEDTSKARAMNEKVANISKDIKNLQVMKKIPIISVCQMNRTKNEDGSQDTTQIGLSDRIGQDATVILMLDRKQIGDGKNQINQLVLNIVKARDGGDGKKLTYAADFNKGLFMYMPEDGDNITSSSAQEIADEYEVDAPQRPGNVF